MKRASSLHCVTIGLAVVLSIGASAARADECDDVITALKRHGDGINIKEAKSPAEFCASIGRLHGLMVSINEIAKQCLDEGRERTAIMKDMNEGTKGMQELMDKQCK
jgi:hypothetical protein